MGKSNCCEIRKISLMENGGRALRSKQEAQILICTIRLNINLSVFVIKHVHAAL